MRQKKVIEIRLITNAQNANFGMSLKKSNYFN